MKKEYKEHINSLFRNNKVIKIFGPAGTGKTTYLINELKELFKKGVQPDRIAFVSFTNKAVDELVNRCAKEFPNIDKDGFKYFRTIHSLCYQQNFDKKKVIDYKEISELAKQLGMEISSYKAIEDGFGSKVGDKIIAIESLSRLRMIYIMDQWRECNFPDLFFFKVNEWKSAYTHYKMKNNLIDFTDMLSLYDTALDIDYIFIDECQDLSPLQWKVMNKAAENCKTVYIAGDDDQSIYSWAGAEIDYILNIKADKKVILPKSYRIPKKIFDQSSKILKRIKVREKKEYTHNGKEGEIDFVYDFKKINYAAENDCLILVRNRWQLTDVKEYLESQGIPYYLFSQSSLESKEVEAILLWEHFRKGREVSPGHFKKICKFSKKLNKLISSSKIPTGYTDVPWFDMLDLVPKDKKDYIRRVLQNGYKINDKPKIRLSTIHQSKGGEADTVVLLTDVSKMVWENIWKDCEHRVWYVAVTRTKNKLIVVQETSTKFYKL